MKENKKVKGRAAKPLLPPVEDHDITEDGLGTNCVNLCFSFSPTDETINKMKSFRRRGIGQRMTDGSFHFVPLFKNKSKSKLIKKLEHGKLSETVDGAVQLTMKVYLTEGVDPLKTIKKEVRDLKL